MEIIVRPAIGATIVTFKGAFDTTAAPAAEKAVREILASGQNHLIFDLSNVPYIASSGLRVLMFALKSAKSTKGGARLAGVFQTVREVMKLTGFDTLFGVYADVDRALEKFAMDSESKVVEGATVIHLKGDIEPDVAPILLEHLRRLFRAAPGRAVLNLVGVNYASVDGLRTLQEAHKAAAELGVDLRLTGVEKALKEAFDLKGLTAQFQIYPKVETAIASFSKR